jgi:hypothetical protein
LFSCHLVCFEEAELDVSQYLNVKRRKRLVFDDRELRSNNVIHTDSVLHVWSLRPLVSSFDTRMSPKKPNPTRPPKKRLAFFLAMAAGHIMLRDCLTQGVYIIR